MTTSQHISQGRDGNEPEIIAVFRAAGASVVKIHEHADLLIGFQGVTLLIEVKTATGKMRQSQLDFQREWRGQYSVVRSIEAALQVIEVTRKMVECLDGGRTESRGTFISDAVSKAVKEGGWESTGETN